MQGLIREIAIYFFFTYVLFMVGYGARDPWSYFFYDNVRNTYMHGTYTDSGSDFMDVSYIRT